MFRIYKKEKEITRDPARIDRILESLGKLWKYFPDMRLGQLLINFTFFVPPPQSSNMWHQEDHETERLLKKMLSNQSKKDAKT